MKEQLQNILYSFANKTIPKGTSEYELLYQTIQNHPEKDEKIGVGINWNDYKPKYKRGVVVKKGILWVDGENGEPVQRNKWLPDYNTPEFSKDREYLQNLIPISK